MNILFTHVGPYASAIALCDQQIDMMLLESVQMLSTALRTMYPESLDRLDELGVLPSVLPDHECNYWVRESPNNFFWLYRHAEALRDIRLDRGEQPHIVYPVLETAIKPFYSELDLDFYLNFPRQHLTYPFLVIKPDEGLKAKHGVIEKSLSRRGSRQKYRAKSWMDAMIVYRHYAKNKVFASGKRPTWTINFKPQWINLQLDGDTK